MESTVHCYIELKRYPRAACHRHHVAPQYTGGGDESANLVWLSANAHALVHRAAQLLKTGKEGHAKDLARQAYRTPAARKRFWDVVLEEVRADHSSTDSGEHRDVITLEVPMPYDEYQRLKLMVSDIRVNGKKMPVQEYVKRLLMSQVQKKIGK